MTKTLSFVVALAVVLHVFTPFVHATLGVDMSSDTCGGDGLNLSIWQCLVNNGYTFAIIEAWDGGYGFNTNIGKEIVIYI